MLAVYYRISYDPCDAYDSKDKGQKANPSNKSLFVRCYVFLFIEAVLSSKSQQSRHQPKYWTAEENGADGKRWACANSTLLDLSSQTLQSLAQHFKQHLVKVESFLLLVAYQ